eukprot:385578-Pyramimonas_sp.AAC.1
MPFPQASLMIRVASRSPTRFVFSPCNCRLSFSTPLAHSRTSWNAMGCLFAQYSHAYPACAS